QACVPVEGFLDVLERELAPEVWVHHAVGEDGPRNIPVGERLMRSEGVVVPHAIDEHEIETRDIFTQPDHGTRRVGIRAAAWAERDDMRGEVERRSKLRCVEGHEFDVMPSGVVDGDALFESFNGAAGGGIDGRDEVQDVHWVARWNPSSRTTLAQRRV